MKTVHKAKARAILRLDHEDSRANVEKELSRLSGVLDYEINYVNDSIRVEFNPLETTIEDLQRIAHM